ncbi:FAD-dependent oxidoreductase [Desulfatirhabdium butyrativorans]|uniref:FAD-dependent oxidoreductase n=1 Tax=Desulfatirhabdium butyrativorans TaxID=340467 RepID=UPI000423FED5|nr:FAD-dependent oxidoreductase [Desulfatirhabdium butyrativorans]
MAKQSTQRVLVIGGGIAGMRAALDLANAGCSITLVEKQGATGGWLSMLDHQFPSNGCGMCRILPHTVADTADQQCLRKGLAHPNIDVLKNTRILEANAEGEGFVIRLRQVSPAVDPSACMGCGLCAEVCPIEVSDAFNCGLSKKKAIHPPLPHAWPARFVIDPAVCTRCGACIDVCPAGAIHLPGSAWGDFRVLVVDDEAIVRDSTRDWLQEEGGFAVDTADSGPAALEMLRQKPYHLMLLDIKMPGMDGVEVLRKAREVLPDLVVIMMTAYATVETAVDALKMGALDYLIKPFDPEALLPKVEQQAQQILAMQDIHLETGAVVLCSGCSLFDPAPGKNPYGYGLIPGVVTSIEFERIMSGTGPTGGKLIRLEDGRPVRKIAWLQCVGSRDLQSEADFCSAVCCMISLKEAVLAKEKLGDACETSIFYMDLRTPEKSGQHYREAAEAAGVRMVRARAHSLSNNPDTHDILLRWVDDGGITHAKAVDMVVLAVGQRPAEDMENLSKVFGFSLNASGFPLTGPFDWNETDRKGVVVAGSAGGMKSIRDSMVLASAAAHAALRAIGYTADAGASAKPGKTDGLSAIGREPPRIGILLFSGDDRSLQPLDRTSIEARLIRNPEVAWVRWQDGSREAAGLPAGAGEAAASGVNRLLVGTGPVEMPSEVRSVMAAAYQLPALLIDVVDIHTPVLRSLSEKGLAQAAEETDDVLREILKGIARLKWITPELQRFPSGIARALVVGAGVAGMSAAIALAQLGVAVDLIEASDTIGGRINDIHRTIDGALVRELRDSLVNTVTQQPNITCRTTTRVAACTGQAGRFRAVLEQSDNGVIEETYGAVILATGIRETDPSLCGYPVNDRILTQLAFERFLAESSCDLSGIDTVVMIQCAGTRFSPRNYCSKVCCATSLKHAMTLKSRKPDIDVYVLVRDMMAIGAIEQVYTQARKAGVIFLTYEPERKPVVQPAGDRVLVRSFERIIGREIEIEADRVILAAGMVPAADDALCGIFGIGRDEDGFIREADIKWHPVRTEREGIFVAGAGLAPSSIPEAIASAKACAVQALPFLASQRPLDQVRKTASVRHSICSLCEQCVAACPFHARSLDPDIDRIVIDPLACRACGICASVCPNDAAVVEGLFAQQMFEIIDGGL